MFRRAFLNKLTALTSMGLHLPLESAFGFSNLGKESVQDLIEKRERIYRSNPLLTTEDYYILIEPIQKEIKRKLRRNGGFCKAIIMNRLFNSFRGEWEDCGYTTAIFGVDNDNFILVPQRSGKGIDWDWVDKSKFFDCIKETKRQQLTRLGITESTVFTDACDIY
jgi:hypothetical protein